MVEWGFTEYFKTGTFPPKPADIANLIRQKREGMMKDEYRPLSQAERDEIAEWRREYFASQEYKDAVARIEKGFAEHPMTARRKQLQKQTQQLQEKTSADSHNQNA